MSAFQGRLGSESAVVLRDREAKVFTNLDGISRMDFDSGKLASLKSEIRRLLISRGVLSADAGE